MGYSKNQLLARLQVRFPVPHLVFLAGVHFFHVQFYLGVLHFCIRIQFPCSIGSDQSLLSCFMFMIRFENKQPLLVIELDFIYFCFGLLIER